jgi:hypothetical protein
MRLSPSSPLGVEMDNVVRCGLAVPDRGGMQPDAGEMGLAQTRLTMTTFQDNLGAGLISPLSPAYIPSVCMYIHTYFHTQIFQYLNPRPQPCMVAGFAQQVKPICPMDRLAETT